MMGETAVKERPILFNGEMVRAILDGRKTQTRRDAKLPLPASPHQPLRWVWSDKKSLFEPVGSVGHISGKNKWGVKPKYGKPGDRLWVRETWGLFDTEPKDGPDNATVFYRSTDGQRFDLRHQLWRPSIHMPRWASRITLEITDVRVERLNDISEEDAIAEGSQCAGVPASVTNVGAFAKLWESINGPGSWATNPWVWVVEFRRLTDA